MTMNVNQKVGADARRIKELAAEVAEAWVIKPESVTRHLAEMSRLVDKTTGQAVAMMRDEGATWAQVGDALGVSPQAAHKRFS